MFEKRHAICNNRFSMLKRRNYSVKQLISVVLLFIGCTFVGNSQSKKNQIDTRVRSSFNSNWKFIQNDITGAEQIEFNDASWRTLNLPHDWSIEGEYDQSNPMGDQCGYLPAGFGWYRKTINVPETWKGKHVEIAFDGVFMNSTVWANGKKLGTRPYGWVSFAYDISEISQTSKEKDES